jgi:DNA modification methylase
MTAARRGCAGTSVFDPVLCEYAYEWYSPKRGRILDPFAGGSVRGIVAECLGRRYTGIELRQEQIDANVRQAHVAREKLPSMEMPRWICADSSHLDELLPFESDFDLLFTCPPYYNLETYSTMDGDGSWCKTYEEFLIWYESIFRQAVSKLAADRFAVIVVGEVRDKKTGFYCNFVGDTVNLFRKLGMAYISEMIMVTPAGSLPVRILKQFPGYRKLGNTHQNILVFYKGNPKEFTLGRLADYPPS